MPTLLAKSFGRKNFGRLIFGHILSQFGQISDKDFGHLAETLLSKFMPGKCQLDSENVPKKIVFLHP